MSFKSWMPGLFLSFFPLITQAQASFEQLQIPQCLAKEMRADYQLLAENSSFKIVEMPAPEIDKLVLLADKSDCGRFVNLSPYFTTSSLLKRQKQAKLLLTKRINRIFSTFKEDYLIQHQDLVEKALSKIDADLIWQNLSHLTSFYNRSATQATGVETANWLKTQFENLALHYGREDTQAYFVQTGSNYLQPSLVTVIGKEAKEPAIVIGAHMDTLDGRMPGAGDDASGSATILEMTRVLMESKLTLKNPVYIVWYAAEERGLVGSQFVVQDFLNKKIPVKAAIQFDMTGYRSEENDPTMWVYRDYTDTKLNSFVSKLIKTYIKVPVKTSSCGYGCSDHASWTDVNVPAAFPCETSFKNHNPYIHTAADSLNLLNRDHLKNFTKLAIAFAIELAAA